MLERQGRLPIGDAVHVALNIARGLEHVHSRNIIHRDIKPDNILITRAGVAKLSDLGLARRTDENSHLTATKQGFGTPWYMPYEQGLNAKQADARSDIYALGATLYHLVAGEVPFPGDNHLEVMEKKDRGDFPPASVHNPLVPPALDQILDRMLARDPKDRYQTVSELIVDLDRSNLAAPIPSFADPTLAREDPYMQACRSSAGQPTQPDLNAINANASVGGDSDEIWYLRRRDSRGEWFQITATTSQIVQQLRAGRLADRVEASHRADTGFQSLGSYPEFRDIRPLNGRRKKTRLSPSGTSSRQDPPRHRAVPAVPLVDRQRRHPQHRRGRGRHLPVVVPAPRVLIPQASLVKNRAFTFSPRQPCGFGKKVPWTEVLPRGYNQSREGFCKKDIKDNFYRMCPCQK